MAVPAKKSSKNRAPAKAAVKPPAKAAPKAAPKAVKSKAPEKAGKAAAAPVVPPKPAAPARPKKSPFSPKELEGVRQVLLQERARLEREAEDLTVGTFDTSQSELSGEVAFDEEYADAGTFTFERERDLSLGNNIRDLMEKVDLALHKIDRGTYGVCERCGAQIPKDRMKALPYSVLCVRCKQLEERQR